MGSDLSELGVQDLQEKYQWLAELIGVEKLILFCETAGGTYHYIPQIASLVKNTVYNDIIRDFDGFNIKQLTQKYKVSESTVRRLVKNQMEAKKKAPLGGQVSLFEGGLQESFEEYFQKSCH